MYVFIIIEQVNFIPKTWGKHFGIWLDEVSGQLLKQKATVFFS
jgi:hypothetical protein